MFSDSDYFPSLIKNRNKRRNLKFKESDYFPRENLNNQTWSKWVSHSTHFLHLLFFTKLINFLNPMPSQKDSLNDGQREYKTRLMCLIPFRVNLHAIHENTNKVDLFTLNYNYLIFLVLPSKEMHLFNWNGLKKNTN